MRIYHSVEEFVQQCAQHKKWNRTVQAIEAAPSLLPDVAYSIGDSLTYWWQPTNDLAQAYYRSEFIGRRRYLTVLTPFSGDARVEVAAKKNLHTVEPYSDLTDRERFSGEGEVITLKPHEILIVEPSEACRVLENSSDSQDLQGTQDTRASSAHTIIEIHVTVEGFSFPNK